MVFDLRTYNSAYESLLNFLGMTGSEFVMDYVVDCNSNQEVFWSKHFDYIDSLDISDVRFMMFHVIGALDGCREIKSRGLVNLQEVLKENTTLSQFFKQNGLTFDICNKTLSYKGQTIDIDFEKFVGRGNLSSREELIEKIAHRIYYDYCTNGFFYCDNIADYGTRIHERPEFMGRVIELFPDLEPMEAKWVQQSKCFKVNFFARFPQLHRFTFSLDETDYFPHNIYQELTDEQKLKKWMVIAAIDRGFLNLSGECYAYVKDDIAIPPEQIISCEPISFEDIE